jgi:hypothetical protein
MVPVESTYASRTGTEVRGAERHLLLHLAPPGNPDHAAASFQRPQRSVGQPGKSPARRVANLQRVTLHIRPLNVDGHQRPLTCEQPRPARPVICPPSDDLVANHRTEEAAGRLVVFPRLAALDHQEPPEDDGQDRRRPRSSGH